VIKARIFGKKQSGGKVELLINRPLTDNQFLVYIRGKVHIGTILLFDQNVHAVVKQLQDDGSRIVVFTQNNNELSTLALYEVLNSIGHVPLPPYINREDTKEDESEYQTVFANKEGAVAAPTASLHFTDELFSQTTALFDHAFVTLHVGAGTFKPVDHEDILDHPMHSEYYTISEKAKDIIESEQSLVAVGTTATRTVEYFVRNRDKQEGEANLFLHPNNPPQRVDHLITNFHLPKSTLIMLVSAFVGVEKTLTLYKEAIKEKYRFYSYGDAMLII
jgi:S-adenosylmethionine:tRNA ribosyltransferase-isomerase